jgi:EmrB/QacA subfamily drug resistance transporter
LLAGKQCRVLAVAEASDRTRPPDDRGGTVTLGNSVVGRTELDAPEAHSRRWTVFAIVSIALFMGSLDQTIVATALPALQHDLHTRINWAAWTITIYALGRVLILPLAGRLSDQYGRRTVFLAAIAVFTVSSLLCGLVDNIVALIVLRGVQAVGGAAFMPSATGMVADHFGAERDRAVGMFTSINPIGGIVGPVLGGVLVAYWSWRGIFLVNVPIGVGLIAVALRYIPRETSRPSAPARLDVFGLAAMGIAILGVMLGVSYLGGRGTSIASPGLIVPAAVGAVAMAAFVRHVRRTEDPFIPLRLLHGRGFGVMNVINFLYGSAALGFGALVPLYATTRYGIGSLESGTLLAARAVGLIAVAGIAAMALRRTGYRWPMIVGFVVTAAGLLAMASAPVGLRPYAWLALGAAVTGFGMGIATPASNNASLQLAPEHVAAVAGLRGMFRQAGQITAVSVTTAILARASDPGITQAHAFAVFAVVMVAIVPFIALVPEHRGTW